MLPRYLQEKVLDLIDIGIDDEQTVLEESTEAVSEKEEKKSQEVVKKLKAEILKNGLAVYGLDETLEAARNGQIDVLIVEKDYKVRGCLCENCQLVEQETLEDCPICGGHVAEVDIIEEIIEFAERSDARIEFTDDKDIEMLGHIGALLRFK
jgi:peptide chain release factor subunit 1